MAFSAINYASSPTSGVLTLSKYLVDKTGLFNIFWGTKVTYQSHHVCEKIIGVQLVGSDSSSAITIPDPFWSVLVVQVIFSPIKLMFVVLFSLEVIWFS